MPPITGLVLALAVLTPRPLAPTVAVTVPAPKAKPVEDLVALVSMPKRTYSAIVFLDRDGFRSRLFDEQFKRELVAVERELSVKPTDASLQRVYELNRRLDDVPGAKKAAERLVEWRRAVVQTAPQDSRNHLALAKALLDAGNEKSAVDSAKEAVRLNPNQAENWRVLARALTLIDSPQKETDTAFEQARKLAPADWRNAMDEAECLYTRTYAVLYPGKAPQVPRPFAPSEKEAATALLDRCDELRREAVSKCLNDPECLRQAAALAMGIVGIRSAIAPFEAANGFSTIVRESLRQLADSEPPLPPAILLSCLMEFGIAWTDHQKEALRPVASGTDWVPAELKNYTQRQIGRIESVIARGGVEGHQAAMLVTGLKMGMQDYPAALVPARKAVELDQSSHTGQYLLSHVLALNGNEDHFREAIAIRRRMLTLEETAESRQFLVVSFTRINNWDAARKELEIAREKHPKDPWLILCQAVCHLHRGHEPSERLAAINLLQKELNQLPMEPEHHSLHLEASRIGVICNALNGHYGAARANLDKYQRLGGSPEEYAKLVAVMGKIDPPPAPSPILVPDVIKK